MPISARAEKEAEGRREIKKSRSTTHCGSFYLHLSGEEGGNQAGRPLTTLCSLKNVFVCSVRNIGTESSVN
jgi:hypothetical protein